MFGLDRDKLFEVTDEDREKAKTSYRYKIQNTLKDNWQLVGSIILIIMIWYYFNYLDTYCLKIKTKIIQYGGDEGGNAPAGNAPAAPEPAKDAPAAPKKESKMSKVKAGASKAKAAAGAGASKAAAYAQRKVDGFKAMSGAIYQVLFQVAMFVMMFLIFGPAIALFGIMILCFAVLKQKIMYVKEL